MNITLKYNINGIERCLIFLFLQRYASGKEKGWNMDSNNGKTSREGSIIKWFISILFLAVLILAPACGSSTDNDLERNEKLWKSENIRNYDFTLTRNCFCPEDWRGPVNIQVRNGLPTSVTYVSNGQIATSEKFGDVNTIEELFNIIHDAYEGRGIFEQKAQTVTVSYHPDKGYPLKIYIDVSQLIADEEQGFTIENLMEK
jgi:hypothetical protein